MTMVPLSETEMVDPLLDWLRRKGRLRDNTLVAFELPWYGRRVDVAMLNASQTTSSFELKLRNNRRAIEQAADNALTFDRSYVVTATPPSKKNQDFAAQLGVGLLLMDLSTDTVITLRSPRAGATSSMVRSRLRRHMQRFSSEVECV